MPYASSKMGDRRTQRAVKRATRASDRRQLRELLDLKARQRRFLAMQMGLTMLNQLEDAGCFHIRDYTRIQPQSVVNAWVGEFSDVRKKR